MAWGETSLVSVECLVQEIRPERDLTARLTLVEAAPGVPGRDRDPGLRRPYHVSTNPGDRSRHGPTSWTQADERALVRASDGTLQSRIVLYLILPTGSTDAERWAAQNVIGIEVQFYDCTHDIEQAEAAGKKYVPGPRPLEKPSGKPDMTAVAITDVEDGRYYDVRVRSVTRFGRRATGLATGASGSKGRRRRLLTATTYACWAMT